MNTMAKMLLGILLIVIPLSMYLYEVYNDNLVVMGIEFNFWGSLWTVIQGTIPPMLVLLGLFIVWLELDEWKLNKELESEDEEESEEEEDSKEEDKEEKKEEKSEEKEEDSKDKEDKE